MFGSMVPLFLSIVNTFVRIRCSCWPLLLPQLQLRAAAAISAAAAVHKDIRISPSRKIYNEIIKLEVYR
jgi:hypothetical protein